MLPFLNPLHTWPTPSFYSEWLAAALGTAIVLATLRAGDSRPLVMPEMLWLPLGLLAVGLLQFAAGMVVSPSHALLYGAMLLLAAGSLIAGRRMADDDAGEGIAIVLSWSLAFSGLLQAGLLVAQAAGVHPVRGMLPGGEGARFAGALGQANHVVAHLWLAAASVAHLGLARRLPASLAAVLATVLALASLLPASRSAFFYPLVLLLLSAFHGYRPGASRSWRWLALGWTIVLALMVVADPLPIAHRGGGAQGPSASERLVDGAADSTRGDLWQVALSAIAEKPLTGHGLGSTRTVMFTHAGDWPAHSTPLIVEHFHNIIVQWGVELGIPAAMLGLWLLLRLLRQGLGAVSTPHSWWALAILAIVGAHSQLEYPLWLAYFLVPATLVAGMLSPGITTLSRPAWRRVASTGGLAAAFLLGSLWLDYRQIERLVYLRAADASPATAAAVVEQAFGLARHSLLADNARLLLAASVGVDRSAADQRWEVCRQGLAVSPSADIVFKCAAIAELAGHREQAVKLARHGLLAYPGYAGQHAGELAELLAETPGAAEAVRRHPPPRLQ